MTPTKQYDVSLFNQLLSVELTKAPREVSGCIGRALRRFAPDIDAQQLRDFVDSIHETIVSDEGILLDDWQQRVTREHWG